VVLLDVDDFWAPLVAQLDRMVAIGLLKRANRELIKRSSTPEQALAILETTEPGHVEKWITPGER
jgi:predicted Rossmann-fold nucleotide-binding protein